jgi:murein L,D-transpeptidase YafK
VPAPLRRILTAAIALLASTASAGDDADVRKPTAWRSTIDNPVARIEEARVAKLAVVKDLFAKAKVAFPPAQLLLRAFKKERRLEMWAASRAGAPLALVATYEVCAASGTLGPKRKQGDLQVPEGFYTLSEYNPASRFHLAMQVSYPNLSDRILGDKRDPGSEIMIHGACASIGCLAMSDERIQEIWIAATALRYAGGVVHVHVFPARDIASLVAATDEAELRSFWENLREGLEYFEAKRQIPLVRVDAQGRYLFR